MFIGELSLTAQRIKKVVIVGGGTAGWMAAASISRLIGRDLDITLVESDEIGTVGVGEATIPTFFALHQLLKINEAEFLSEVQGTIKLGISFENWKNKGEDYIHAFGYTGKSCWAAGFQHFWLKGKGLGLSEEYSHYSPELMAAKANKFGPVSYTHLPAPPTRAGLLCPALLYSNNPSNKVTLVWPGAGVTLGIL